MGTMKTTKPIYNVELDVYSNGYACTIKKGKKVLADAVFEGPTTGPTNITALRFKKWQEDIIQKDREKDKLGG